MLSGGGHITRPAEPERSRHASSGRQHRRIGIAPAPCPRSPDVIVCDQPTSPPGASVLAQIPDPLRALPGAPGLTNPFISLDLRVMHRMAARIDALVVGRRGKLARSDAPFATPSSVTTGTRLAEWCGPSGPGT